MAVAQPVVIQADAVTFPTTLSQLSPVQKLRNDNDVGVNVERIVLSGAQAISLGVSLRLRNQPITSGFVPWGAVAWPINPGNEQYSAVLELTKPIYLAPGDFIDIAYRNDLYRTADSVYAVAIGKQCTHAERSTYLPYLAAFQTATYDGTANTVIDERSTPQDLGNPFTDEIVVSHLVGRVFAGAVATLLTASFGGGSDSSFFVRLADSRDAFYVPKFTPLPLVVDAESYVWQVNRPMPPRDYLKLEVQGTANWNGAGVYQFSRMVFGMQGYRRIG